MNVFAAKKKRNLKVNAFVHVEFLLMPKTVGNNLQEISFGNEENFVTGI